MKKFFRHPITLTVLVIFAIILILALCGFRITYNPSLDNNWDAISACAAWAAVIVSGIAIYFAIQAPKKIAEEQNRIALFEKRYEFYIAFTKSTAFIKAIELSNIKTKEEAKKSFIMSLSGKNVDDVGESDLEHQAMLVLYDVISVLGQAKYLFNLESDESLGIFSKDLIDLLKSENDEVFQSCYKKIKISAANTRAELNAIFEKHLNLND